MHEAVLGALAGIPSLSESQLSGVITTLATMRPHLLRQVALRDDLTDETRLRLVEVAEGYLVVDLLELLPADPGLIDAAARHPRELPGLIGLCGKRGWDGKAIELAGGVEAAEVGSVATRWSRAVGSELPEPLVVALVNSALTDRGEPPELEGLNRWEHNRLMERLRTEREQREQAAWSLLEERPAVWRVLVAGPHGETVRRMLLERAGTLSDELLMACLPVVTRDFGAGGKYVQGIRLQSAADHVRRWPRLRQIAAVPLAEFVRDVVARGWEPVSRYSGPDWDDIAALAELTDDGDLLRSVVVSIRESCRGSDRDRALSAKDADVRASAIELLVANPRTPRDALLDLVPLLDEPSLLAVERRSEDELTSASRSRREQLAWQAQTKKPPLIRVPTDAELAGEQDPAAILAGHLRNLRGRAAQRDLTTAGLLQSRYSTPELLRALPARQVLDSPGQVKQVAKMIAEVCGDDEKSWLSLASVSDENISRTLAFGKWLDGLK
ncbi:hypothetical protein [Amycolatopsis eburnea]|uniref:Uncharacterized protein n=1 Tax=Amycolatopsis eburnea TaxID=2267691 RepID=A0A3R9F6G4_9PSEU|nr:hypothetical protein [Amycolatopsis eburnea]RSD13560.1 hypothetical protein EIY87_28025 [Amycolatopsis eburnea]